MDALVLHEAGGPLTLEETPTPRPGPGECLVRVRACGLGLTLAWNRTDRVGTFPGRLPRIIGHEIAGDVAEVGEGVGSFKEGDRVNVFFYLTCGDCRWCNVGREDLCDNHTGLVGSQIDGGLAEYVSLPVRNLCHIPDDLGYVDAAITADAVATPLHVLRERAKVRPPETVLIVGAGGGVGIHMVQMAKVLGAKVIGVDISAEKLALAKEMGADDVINSLDGPFNEEALRLTGGRGVDVVVELVGRPDTMTASIRSLDKGGRLVFVGFYDVSASIDFRPSYIMQREITFTGSRYCSRQELAEAVEMVARGQIRPVVTRTCKLEEADEVLRSIERMEIAGRACVEFS
ncbi:MAG: zinc-binding dehydrogenase [Chloroflexi bacterium]|nr:zinc-binding dehydrogenase [Chloroflexota bacterium]